MATAATGSAFGMPPSATAHAATAVCFPNDSSDRLIRAEKAMSVIMRSISFVTGATAFSHQTSSCRNRAIEPAEITGAMKTR